MRSAMALFAGESKQQSDIAKELNARLVFKLAGNAFSTGNKIDVCAFDAFNPVNDCRAVKGLSCLCLACITVTFDVVDDSFHSHELHPGG